MQPVQHVPATHFPLLQPVPSGLSGSTQAPFAQVDPVLHSERQLTQAAPPAPQYPG
jgi:hypothetical protein